MKGCKQSDRQTSFLTDRLWSREAPQVIVVVPHFLSSQAVTQLERCDQLNMAGGELGVGGSGI